MSAVSHTVRHRAAFFDIDGTLTTAPLWLFGESKLSLWLWRKAKQIGYARRLMEKAEPNPQAIETLRWLRSQGVIIVLVTGRDRTLEDVTKAWLEKHKVPYDFLCMRRDVGGGWSGYHKLNTLHSFTAHKRLLFVEDNTEQLLVVQRGLIAAAASELSMLRRAPGGIRPVHRTNLLPPNVPVCIQARPNRWKIIRGVIEGIVGMDDALPKYTVPLICGTGYEEHPKYEV